jgi:predicted amidohydrolase
MPLARWSVYRQALQIGIYEGAQLAVLPETFVPLYPSNAWARKSAAFAGSDLPDPANQPIDSVRIIRRLPARAS